MNRCQATVYKPELMRRARTGNHMGFKRYYSPEQCQRQVKEGNYCWQHNVNRKKGKEK